jgi:hypothetical protein
MALHLMADTDTDTEHTCRITRDPRIGNACCVPLPQQRTHAMVPERGELEASSTML